MKKRRKRHKSIDTESIEAVEWLMEKYDFTCNEIAEILRESRHETVERTVYRWLSGESRCDASIPITIATKLWLDGRMSMRQFETFARNV